MAGQFKHLPTPKAFGPEPQFSGFMAPSRFEGEVNNLEVVGELPSEISGTFYRVMPDPQFPSYIPGDVWFNGDGNISAFRTRDGHVDFKQRYVRTEKFVREADARRALLGKFRNKYTDAVEFKIRSTANTNIVYFGGKLLALKEDSPPYALDPQTLETIGLWDFNGQLPCFPFTAHPKFDPVTREMLCFGYEAKGDGTPDICFYVVQPDETVSQTVWLSAPVCAMIHDFGVTENYVIFPIIPLTCNVERLKQGGEHFQYDGTMPCYFGVLPRRGGSNENAKASLSSHPAAQWFRAPHACTGHVANAYEDASGNIILDIIASSKNLFFFWPDKDGNTPKPQDIQSNLARWTIDPSSTNMELSAGETMIPDNVEFPRIDDRFAMHKHTRCFVSLMDPRLGTDFTFVLPVMGGGAPHYNALATKNLATSKYKKYFPGPRKIIQECIFIPRHGHSEEGDGYIIALVNNYESMSSELVVLDTQSFAKEIALIKHPLRLRAGVHGNWVDNRDADGHPTMI
ncbi:hypothetical protein OIDMADRAFT_139524 [Oidiodendron maius Zn]|uniref:Carotenoid oxygenase n=1 Tax=Oidiodendron maius (strain Zn) TaxID=913774 RepID=A0A0C3C124_OIDMZ|nr:hypothetical protein OIDMADRAFT_139524 [Oidiodendron maius Zn]